MTKNEQIFNSCFDELEKIAGASRIGSLPILPGTLVKKGSNVWGRKKVAAATPNTSVLKGRAGLATAALGGAVGYHALSKANQDRRMGRAMRIQQSQGY